jgi:hypothetical protein
MDTEIFDEKDGMEIEIPKIPIPMELQDTFLCELSNDEFFGFLEYCEAKDEYFKKMRNFYIASRIYEIIIAQKNEFAKVFECKNTSKTVVEYFENLDKLATALGVKDESRLLLEEFDIWEFLKVSEKERSTKN